MTLSLCSSSSRLPRVCTLVLLGVALCSFFLATAEASAKCHALLQQFENYKDYEFCPETTLGNLPAHEGAFSGCPTFPQRRCVQRTPDKFIQAPNQTAYRHNPPSANVRRSPNMPYQEFSSLAARKTGDCVTCWRFAVERQRWNVFIDMIESKIGVKFAKSAVRTVLDFGAGSGGFLSAMMDRGVIGIGFARNWADLPYLETAAARGALVMHMDFRRHIPMAPGAVDMVHCSWLMNVLDTREEIESVLLEWDRLVRPGGYIVQHGFRAKNEETFTIFVNVIENLTKMLSWDMLEWSTGVKADSKTVLTFIARKPLRRSMLRTEFVKLPDTRGAPEDETEADAEEA